MLLAAGDRLGPYEIVGLVGTGGMGEVYRARDPRVGRDVAIKLSAERFSHRFEVEARAIAALNHRNVCTLYDVGPNYLVLEFVDGESPLGPQPLATALTAARQIVEAIESAHQKGIVHRDLKPANIKVTADGVVKVLDFGLAKLSSDRYQAEGSLTLSTATMASPQASVVMGTLAYMAPEQMCGETVDKRVDIWAFGVLLYYLLTGRPAFPGETVSEVQAAILHAEPDWGALPASTPPSIRRLLKRCLQKDPKRRLPDIGVARLEIDDATVSEPPVETLPADRRPKRWIAAGVIGAAVAGLVLSAFAWSLRSPGAAAPAVTRFSFRLEPEPRTAANFPSMALSPDGRHIVFATNRGLFLRSMSELTTRVIPGTEIAEGDDTNPVFSPDGQDIAFNYAAPGNGPGAIMKIAVTGGTAMRLLETDFPPFGISWGADGILLARSFSKDRKGIVRISPDGGPPELVVAAADEFFHGPSMLPDGQTVLLTVATGGSADRWDNARIVAQTLRSGDRKTLIEGATDARYLTSGHLVYAGRGRLFAVALDPKRLSIVGNPVPVVEGIWRPLNPTGPGSAHFDTSNTGALVYASPPRVSYDLALIDRHGAVERLNFPSRPYGLPRVSPDGTRVAVTVDTGDDADIWVGALAAGGPLRRLTFGGGNRFPAWSADGRRVTFQADRDGDRGIFWQVADGSAPAERLTTARSGTSHEPESWSSSGDTLLFRVTSGSRFSLWSFSVKDRAATPFGNVESSVPPIARFSPDGRWVAYMARDGEKFLLYAQPFPPTGAKYQIADGGILPTWSRDGRQLYYFHGPGQLAAVNVQPQPVFTVGAPVELWNQKSTKARIGGDVTPDGRFLSAVFTSDPPATITQIQVVLNWYQELMQRVPVRN